MIRPLLFALLVHPLVGWGQDTYLAVNKLDLDFRDGFFYYQNSLYSGFYTLVYSSRIFGRSRAIEFGRFENGVKDELFDQSNFNGVVVTYYEGKSSLRLYFKEGKLRKEKCWDKEGRLYYKRTVNYEKGKVREYNRQKRK